MQPVREVKLEAIALTPIDERDSKLSLSVTEPTAAQRVINANQVHFNDLYRDYKRRVYGTVHHIVGQCDEIDDIVQTVFLEIHRSLSRYQGQAKLSTWIYRISVNVALQYIRKRKRRRVFLFHSAEGHEFERAGDDVRVRYEQREVMSHLYRLLDRLNEKKRTVFVLYELEGLPFEEISEICRIPVNTVRSRLHAARGELTVRLRRAGLLEAYHGRG